MEDKRRGRNVSTGPSCIIAPWEREIDTDIFSTFFFSTLVQESFVFYRPIMYLSIPSHSVLPVDIRYRMCPCPVTVSLYPPLCVKLCAKGTHQVRDVLVSLELGARIGPRLGAGLEVGDALRRADDGAVEGEGARALDELVPLVYIPPFVPFPSLAPSLQVLFLLMDSCRGRRTCSSERAAPGKREGLLEKRRDCRTRFMGGGGLRSLVRDRTGISLPLITAGKLR